MSKTYDIIPDIHGQVGKLTGALSNLGYREHGGAWRHSEPDRNCIFLGDLIDRGPANGAVIDIVRRMIDAGTAQAIMGNHELNAIHFHTVNTETGEPLREHSGRNLTQHAAFLDEFPLGAAKTKDAVNWMATLPLFLEFDGFRVVHACWHDPTIDALAGMTRNGVASMDQIITAADKSNPLFGLFETTTKGPEIGLPEGFVITDKQGIERHDIRVKWWVDGIRNWRDVAISVPDRFELPLGEVPRKHAFKTYSADAKLVFFGHYWLTGAPVLQSPNTLCLDYSAGKDGPVVSYRFEDATPAIDVGNLTVAELGDVER